MVDPQTSADWQVAVDMAEACLLLESARLYGFVTGGPAIDRTRCEQILSDGAARGVVPSRAGVDDSIVALVTLP